MREIQHKMALQSMLCAMCRCLSDNTTIYVRLRIGVRAYSYKSKSVSNAKEEMAMKMRHLLVMNYIDNCFDC